jgi:hypothetical protein
MPAASPPEPAAVPSDTSLPGDLGLSGGAGVPGGAESASSPDLAAGRARYLAEVRRRRASGDLPPVLERQLDELFLEFSPVGLQGRARLRETLAPVDGAAYVDIAVPVASNKAIGTYVKRLIRKSLQWYLGFIVHQIVRFAWAVSRMLHLMVDHVEHLEATVDPLRLPLGCRPLPGVTGYRQARS